MDDGDAAGGGCDVIEEVEEFAEPGIPEDIVELVFGAGGND